MLHAPCVFADVAGTFDASNRAEVRGRTMQIAGPNGATATGATGPGAPPNPSLDLADTVTARLGLDGRHWQYSIGYSALGILGDVEASPARGGLTTELMQTGDVRAVWSERRVRLGLGQYGRYGEQNSALQLAAPQGTGSAAQPGGGGVPSAPGAVQVLAQPVTLFAVASRTTLDGEFRLSRRWDATTLVEYDLAGGADAASRVYLPLVQGPRAQAMLAFDAARRDTLETRASALRSDTTPGVCYPGILGVTASDTCAPEAESVQLTETWRHRLTRASDAALGGGASYVHVRLRPGDPFVDVVYPVASATFEQRTTLPTDRSVARVDVQLLPVVDVLTGGIDERVQGTVALTVPVQRLVLTASAGATRSVESPFLQPVTSFQGVAEADYLVDKQVSFGGGVRYVWQDVPPFGTFYGAMAYAQITVSAPTARF